MEYFRLFTNKDHLSNSEQSHLRARLSPCPLLDRAHPRTIVDLHDVFSARCPIPPRRHHKVQALVPSRNDSKQVRGAALRLRVLIRAERADGREEMFLCGCVGGDFYRVHVECPCVGFRLPDIQQRGARDEDDVVRGDLVRLDQCRRDAIYGALDREELGLAQGQGTIDELHGVSDRPGELVDGGRELLLCVELGARNAFEGLLAQSVAIYQAAGSLVGAFHADA